MIYSILSNPVVFNTLVLLASLFILFKSADLIVYSITRYAKKVGLSDAIIGLVVIAMAASAPEIISSLTGFLTGNEAIGFAAIIGSNMVHTGLALAFLCIIGKKIKLETNIFTKQRFAMWLALMLPFILAMDGLFSRPDGAIMVIAFMIYLLYLWKIEGTFGKIKKNVKLKNIWEDGLVFLGSFAALMLAGRWLVVSSVHIANYYAIPPWFVGLTVVSIGATLPDFAIELKSLFSKHASVGLGDLLGSLILELLLFFGLLALIKPLKINLAQTAPALITLATSITLIMFWMNKKYLTWKHGLTLLSLYIIFMSIEVWKIL